MEKHRFFSVFVVVSLVVALAFTGSLVVLAQDPTEGPTAELTVEPTVEPTEEPTVEPTEEPTVEPTEEPTVEPTEEPTVEPTEEPTVEPTEEPTVEPTEEPTEEPTVEPAGEVGATAFGSWTTERIAVQNVSGGSVTAQLELYQGGAGDPVQTIDLGTIAATGSAWVSSSQISTNGRYAGIISASGAVAAAVHNYNASGHAADFYYGQNTPEQEMWCPLVFGAGYSGGWTTNIHAQNATGSAQNIRIRIYQAGQTTPKVDFNQNVAANASYTFDFKSDSRISANFKSTNFGYARLTGASGNIVVVVDLLRERSSTSEQVVNTYSGVPTSQAGTSLLMALVFKGYSGGWDSGIGVINIGTATTTVTVQYTPSNVCTGCTGGTDSLQIAPGARETFYLPSRSVPHTNWFGSAEVTSSGGQNIIALATTANYSKEEGAVGYSLLGASPSTATPHIAVPLLYRSAGTSNAWITGVQVRNMGGATNVTLSYVRAPGCSVGNATYTWTQSATANGGSTFYTPNHPQNIPTGWYGVAYVSSSTSNNMLASVQMTGYPLGVAGVYNGINY